MANQLKEELLSRERSLVGCWTMFGSPLVAEAMAWCDYDLIVIDAEHTPLSAMSGLGTVRAKLVKAGRAGGYCQRKPA